MTVCIGDLGVTVTPLMPGGIVRIADSRHSARCEAGYIEANAAIIVITGDNLGLLVRPAPADGVVTTLANHGQVVFSSFGAKVQARGNKREERHAARWERGRRRSLIAGAVCGLLAAGYVVSQLWGTWDSLSPVGRLAVTVAWLIGGSGWGMAVGRVQYGSLSAFEFRHSKYITTVATAITMAGTAAILGMILPTRGTIVGLGLALCVSGVLGSFFPVLGILGEWLAGAAEEADGAGEDTTDADID